MTVRVIVKNDEPQSVSTRISISHSSVSEIQQPPRIHWLGPGEQQEFVLHGDQTLTVTELQHSMVGIKSVEKKP